MSLQEEKIKNSAQSAEQRGKLTAQNRSIAQGFLDQNPKQEKKPAEQEIAKVFQDLASLQRYMPGEITDSGMASMENLPTEYVKQFLKAGKNMKELLLKNSEQILSGAPISAEEAKLIMAVRDLRNQRALAVAAKSGKSGEEPTYQKIISEMKDSAQISKELSAGKKISRELTDKLTKNILSIEGLNGKDLKLGKISKTDPQDLPATIDSKNAKVELAIPFPIDTTALYRAGLAKTQVGNGKSLSKAIEILHAEKPDNRTLYAAVAKDENTNIVISAADLKKDQNQDPKLLSTFRVYELTENGNPKELKIKNRNISNQGEILLEFSNGDFLVIGAKPKYNDFRTIAINGEPAGPLN